MRSPAATILATLALTSCAEPSSPGTELRAASDPAFAKAGGIITTDLGTLPNGSASVAWAIDAVGTTIVGYAPPSTESGVPWHATRWTLANGVWTIEDLTGFFPSGTAASNAADINANGDIVGYMAPTSGPNRAYLLPKGAAQAIDLHAPLCNGATDTGNNSSANAINVGGEVVGTRYTAPDPNYASRRAFHWAAGCATLLPTLGDPSSPAGTYDVASDINDNGVVAGMSRDVGGVLRTVRWTRMTGGDGTVTWEITQLPIPTGFTSGGATAINNAATIVGSGHDAAEVRVGLCWEPSGEVTTMPTLAGDSHPYAINEAGDVVGYSYDNSGVQHAVRWPATGGIQKLTRLGVAHDVNDKKQIVGDKSSKGIRATLWTLP